MINPIIDFNNILEDGDVIESIENGFVDGIATIICHLTDGNSINIIINNKGKVLRSMRVTPVKDITHFTADEIMMIERDIITSGLDFPTLTTKYNISDKQIKYIHSEMNRRIKSDPFYRYPSDEEVIQIFNDCKSGMSDEEISDKYTLSPKAIMYIRTIGTPRYKKLLANEEKILYSQYRNGYPEEIAVAVYQDLKNGATYKDIKDKYGMDDQAAAAIKFIRSPYEYLNTKYGFNPLEGGNKRATDKEKAVTIYHWMKDNKATLKETCRHFHHGSDVIQAIRNCSGYYSFLKDEYGLEPMTGKI